MTKIFCRILLSCALGAGLLGGTGNVAAAQSCYFYAMAMLDMPDAPHNSFYNTIAIFDVIRTNRDQEQRGEFHGAINRYLDAHKDRIGFKSYDILFFDLMGNCNTSLEVVASFRQQEIGIAQARMKKPKDIVRKVLTLHGIWFDQGGAVDVPMASEFDLAPVTDFSAAPLVEPAPSALAADKGGHSDEHALLVSRENNQKIDLTVISEAEAAEAFSQIVARGDIPFAYLKDGCYSRAHKMALLLDDKGIASGKAFMEGRIYYDTPKQGEVGWSYQVAPVVLVRKEGQIIPYVIDPSLFARPVPVSEWKAKLTQKPKTEITAQYFTNRFSYDPQDRNMVYSDYQEDHLNDMDSTNRNLARELYVLEHSQSRKK